MQMDINDDNSNDINNNSKLNRKSRRIFASSDSEADAAVEKPKYNSTEHPGERLDRHLDEHSDTHSEEHKKTALPVLSSHQTIQPRSQQDSVTRFVAAALPMTKHLARLQKQMLEEELEMLNRKFNDDDNNGGIDPLNLFSDNDSDLEIKFGVIEQQEQQKRARVKPRMLIDDDSENSDNENSSTVGAKEKVINGANKETEEEDEEKEKEGDDNKEEDQDDAMYDSDGNFIDDENRDLKRVTVAKKSKLVRTPEVEDEIEGVYGGQGASLQKRRKNGGATKKEILEMRKQSERLKRSVQVELPSRRGNLDIDKLLSMHNIERPKPKNTGWSKTDSDDDSNDGDYNPDDNIGFDVPIPTESKIEAIQLTDQDVTTGLNELPPNSDPNSQANILDVETPAETIQSASSKINKQANFILKNFTPKVDMVVSKSQLHLLQITNRALIRQQIDHARAVREINKPHGKGRQLTRMEQDLLVMDAFAALNSDGDDDEIEVVDVVDHRKDAVMAVGGTVEVGKISVEEKNRRLAVLARRQNRMRRETEAREYAEALEAKRRKRKEKKAARLAAENG
ncbi:hypothetical protein HK100_000509, partial [Physocladia obscura]